MKLMILKKKDQIKEPKLKMDRCKGNQGGEKDVFQFLVQIKLQGGTLYFIFSFFFSNLFFSNFNFRLVFKEAFFLKSSEMPFIYHRLSSNQDLLKSI